MTCEHRCAIGIFELEAPYLNEGYVGPSGTECTCVSALGLVGPDAEIVS